MASWAKTGIRFKEAKEKLPGPGAYDPRLVEGWKADPKSGFLGHERFRSQEISEEDLGSSREVSPPRQRKNAVSVAGTERKFSWATQRIAELTHDLEKAAKRVKELEKQVKTQHQEFEFQTATLRDKAKELEDSNAKHKAVATAAEQRLMDLKEEIEQSLQQEAALQQEQEQLLATLEQLQLEKQTLQGSKAKLQNDLDAAGTSLKEGATQLTELTTALEDKEQQLEQAKKQLNITASAAVESCRLIEQQRQDLDALTSAHEALQQELTEVVDSLEAEQQERAAAAAALADNTMQLALVKQQLAAEQQGHSEAAAARDERDAQLAALEERLAASQQELAATCSCLELGRKEHATSKELLAAVEQQLASEQAAHAESKVMLQQEQKWLAEEQEAHVVTQRKLGREQANAAALSERLVRAEEQSAAEEGLHGETKRTLQQEQQRLAAQLAAAEEHLATLQQQVAEAQKTHAATNSSLADVQQRLSLSMQELESEQKRHAGTTAALKHEQEQHAVTTHELATAGQELETSAHSIEELQHLLQQQQEASSELNTQLQQQTAAADTAAAEVQQLQHSIQQQEAECLKLSEELSQQQSSARAAAAKAATEAQELQQQLQAALTEAEKQQELLIAESAARSAAVGTCQQLQLSLAEQKAAADGSLAELQGQLQQLLADQAALQQQLTDEQAATAARLAETDALLASETRSHLDAKAEIAALTALLHQRDAGLATAEEDKRLVDELFAAARSEVAELQQQVAEAQRQAGATQDELTAATGQLEATQQKLDTEGAERLRLEEEREQLQAQVWELQHTRNAANNTAAAVQQELGVVKQQLTAATAGKDALQKQLAEVDSQLERAAAQHAELLLKHETVVADSRVQVEDNLRVQQMLQGTEAALVDARAERDALSADLAGRTSELQEASSGLTQCMAELTAVQQQLEEAEARAASSAADQRSTAAQLVNTQQQLQETEQQLQHTAGIAAALEQQLQVAHATIDTVKSEKAELRSRIAEWEEEMARMDNLVEQLNAKVSEQESKEVAYRDMQDKLKEQLATLAAANTSLEACLAQSRTVEANLSQASTQLSNQLQEHVHKLQQMQEARQHAEDQCTAKAAELAEAMRAWTTREDELVAEVSLQQDKLAAQVKLQKQAQEELEALRKQLEAGHNEICKMSMESESLGLELGRAQGEVARQLVQLQEMDSMQQELAAAYERNAELQDRVAAAQQELAEVKAEAAARTPVGATVEQAVRGLQKELEVAFRKLAAAQAEAVEARASAGRSATLTLEMGRLQDDNAVLTSRLEQMANDLKELLGTSSSGLGHSNPRQKIQYHLKLKQELEELRHEATVLLRERFHLQQCVRYLAARAKDPLAAEPNMLGTAARGPTAKVQPASLAGNVLYTSPLSARSMVISGRGRMADKGTVYTSKETFEKEISSVQRRTIAEMASWGEPVEAAQAMAAAAHSIRSTAAEIASLSAESSAADVVRSSEGEGSVSAAGEGAMPVTPVAAAKDITFSTPRSSFTGGDQRRNSARRAGRWARDSHASPAGGSEGLLTPIRRFSESTDVATTADSANGTCKTMEKHLTPTPARNAAAGIEQRILDKIAAVCSPGPGGRLHAVRRSAAIGASGGNDLAPR